MTTHSSILAWEILWTEEPGGLQFMGLQRVRYNWATEHACMPHLWIHPWLVLTLLAYLYVSWTKQTNKQKNYHVALGPSILSTWKAFHAFIWSHSTICWKFLSQGLRSRPISPDMAISFVFSFPETHWFGVSIGYVLYVKCSAILLSTLPPIAYIDAVWLPSFFRVTVEPSGVSLFLVGFSQSSSDTETKNYIIHSMYKPTQTYTENSLSFPSPSFEFFVLHRKIFIYPRYFYHCFWHWHHNLWAVKLKTPTTK